MKLNPNIQILIDYQKKELRGLEKKLNNSLKMSKPHTDLQIMIKHFVGDLRDSLDYIAHQIYEENYDTYEEDKVYFPILSLKKEKFNVFMERNFPNLSTKNSNIFSYLEKIQYYNNLQENVWMNDITFLTNYYKHKDFLKQELRLSNKLYQIGTKKGILFSVAKGATLRLSKLSLEDVGIEDATFSYDLPDPKIAGLVLKRTTVNQFHFTDLRENKSSKPVMKTLRGILVGVQRVVQGFEKT